LETAKLVEEVRKEYKERAEKKKIEEQKQKTPQ
jgi:hypothetical protein